MENEDVCQELIRVLRLQRHDFINHLQVVHAFLQLGKTEKAMKYIEDVTRDESLLAAPLAMHVRREDCRTASGK